jgi:hypothetical protein
MLIEGPSRASKIYESAALHLAKDFESEVSKEERRELEVYIASMYVL